MKGVVFIDPSPRGDWALLMVFLLPDGAFTRLRLVATQEDVSRDPDLLVRAREQLQGIAPELVDEVHPGPAESALAAALHREEHDLLIVPPAGRNALLRMIRGSRVATLLRDVHAPILVARRPPARLTRILTAVSGGGGSVAVCTSATTLARRLGSHIGYVHVVSEVRVPFGQPEASPLSHQSARRALEEAGTDGSLGLREGLVVEEILEEFESGAYQLLVVGSHAESECEEWGEEDIAERLLLRCPGSVLVVPPSGLLFA